MSVDRDPPRLSDSDAASPADALLRAALRQARSDVSPDAALARMAARLPVGPPPGGGGPASGGGAPAPAGAAGGAPAATPLFSSIATGAVAGVVVSLGLWLSGLDTPPPPPPSSAPAAVTAMEKGGAMPAGEGETAPFAGGVAPVRSASPARGPAASAAPAAEPAAPPESGILGSGAPPPSAAPAASGEANSAGAGAVLPGVEETEAALLARAQAQIGANPAGALALTEQHRSRFPRGTLGQEREVIAVSALMAMGRAVEARARAESLIAANPGSAFRRRLSVIVPGLSADPQAP